MNVLRQIVTTPADGILTIPLPKSYQKRRVEIIIIDLDEESVEPEENYGLPPHLNTPKNRYKILNREVLSARLQQAMDAVAAEAAANGMTEEILNDILNDPAYD